MKTRHWWRLLLCGLLLLAWSGWTLWQLDPERALATIGLVAAGYLAREGLIRWQIARVLDPRR